MPGIAAKSQSAERQSPQDTPTKGNFVEMDYGSWEQVAVAQTKSESIVSKASRESINADEQPPISEERDHNRCGSRQGPPHYRLKQPEPLWTIGLHEIGQEEPAGGIGARRPMSVRGSASDTPVPPTPSPRMVLAKQQRQSVAALGRLFHQPGAPERRCLTGILIAVYHPLHARVASST